MGIYRFFKKRPPVWLLFILVPLGIGMVLGLVFLFVLLFMLLWNVLMPDIFNLSTIDYWQAMGLLLMARLLFGMGFHSRPGYKKKRFYAPEDWKTHFKERFHREKEDHFQEEKDGIKGEEK